MIDTDTGQDRLTDDILGQLIRSAEERRKAWLRSGTLLVQNAVFEDRDKPLHRKLRSDFGARIPKAAEALQVFMPRISVDRGLCRISPRETAEPARKEQLKVTEDLVNVMAKTNDRFRYHQSAVKSMLLRGRGIRFTGVSESGVVYSPTIPSEDFLLDPNSDDPAGAAWAGHYEIMPRWRLLDEVGKDDKARLRVIRLPRWSAGGDDRVRRTIASPSGEDNRIDCVRIVRIYMRYGLHRYKRGLDSSASDTSEDKDTVEVDDTPRLYLVSSDDHRVIQERAWEIPYHLDAFDPFPYTRYDTPNMADELWPFSILEAGRPYMEWMNWLFTLMMGKTKVTMRLLMAMRQGLNQKTKEKIINGVDIDILEIPGQTGNRTLKQFVEQFNWSNDDIQYAMALLDRLDFYYALATGQSSVLYSGDLGRQMRSAEEARVVREMSSARMEMLRAAVLDAEARNFRKEAFACRYLYNDSQVATFVGKAAAAKWGTLVPDGALEKVAGLLASKLGLPPEQAAMIADQMAEQSRPVTMSEWIYAADYKLEVGSTLRENFELARAMGDAVLNQPFAALLKLAESNPAALPMAYSLLPAVARLNQWPEEYLQPLKDGEEVARVIAALHVQQMKVAAQQPPPGAAPPAGAPPPEQPMGA